MGRNVDMEMHTHRSVAPHQLPRYCGADAHGTDEAEIGEVEEKWMALAEAVEG